MQIRSFAGDIWLILDVIVVFPISDFFLFKYKTKYWRYSKIVNFRLVVRQRKVWEPLVCSQW